MCIRGSTREAYDLLRVTNSIILQRSNAFFGQGIKGKRQAFAHLVS